MLAGALAVLQLPVAQYPAIAPPSIGIRATYPGADAQTLENTVTQVIEQRLNGIDGLRYFTAESNSAGTVSINLTFDEGVDPDIAQVQVQNKLAAAEPLPGPAAWLPRRFRWAEMAALAAVAALLIAIVAPLFMGVRANAAKTLCLNNARLVAYATRVYANDHWDHMPSGDRWDRSLRPYVHSELVFYCPAPNGMLYGFPAELSGESLQAMVYPSATLTLFDQGPRPGDFAPRHHGVGSVAFLDGHVTALPSLPDLPGISRPAGPASSAAHGRSAGPPE